MLWVWIIGLAIPLAVGGLAGRLTMGSMATYGALVQPPLAPPPWVFPVVWAVLYLLMGIASVLVWKADVPQEEKKRALTWYGAQLAANFVWPLLFFNAGLYGIALMWLVLLLALVTATIVAFRQINPTAAWLLVPYALWLLFATYLNAAIWLLNR
ncbi:TspO/MBR family protein [Agathobaculum sp. Marseille-P7918]|uniref:TspO/MBR family protein n=1 Tax=Agathobaculum sp. Marseille-P7918 TaxID=2479843 RepID=UPI003568917A